MLSCHALKAYHNGQSQRSVAKARAHKVFDNGYRVTFVFRVCDSVFVCVCLDGFGILNISIGTTTRTFCRTSPSAKIISKDCKSLK